MIEIKKKEMCTGCYACENICPQDCITMEKDYEGFWYPIVNKAKCTNCGLCEEVCPILHKIELHDLPIAYAAYNKNEKVRMKSSSGGLFTLTAEEIIDEDGVVFGAGFDENFNVVHSYVECKEELFRFRGSKYVQSKIGDTYKQVKDFLTKGKKVLFTGTPCQVAGLKSYLGKDYENLICQDIICHGVPSPDVWEKYLKYREREANSKALNISFRSKKMGWKRFSIDILYENSFEYSDTINKDMYLLGFNKSLFLRPSCYSCSFKIEQRQADITLADFWGIHDVISELDDDKGISALFIHSKKGNKIFDKIKDKLILTQVENKDIIQHNPAMIKSMELHPNREKFFKNLNTYDFNILFRKYCKDRLPIRIKRKLKIIIKRTLIKLGIFNLVKTAIKQS